MKFKFLFGIFLCIEFCLGDGPWKDDHFDVISEVRDRVEFKGCNNQGICVVEMDEEIEATTPILTVLYEGELIETFPFF